MFQLIDGILFKKMEYLIALGIFIDYLMITVTICLLLLSNYYSMVTKISSLKISPL